MNNYQSVPEYAQMLVDVADGMNMLVQKMSLEKNPHTGTLNTLAMQLYLIAESFEAHPDAMLVDYNVENWSKKKLTKP